MLWYWWQMNALMVKILFPQMIQKGNTEHTYVTDLSLRFSKFYIYELLYNSNTVLYQFLELGTSDITFMGRDQQLKWLSFSLYPFSFFLYSPFIGYESGIAIFAWRVDWNYTYNPLNFLIQAYIYPYLWPAKKAMNKKVFD